MRRGALVIGIVLAGCGVEAPPPDGGGGADACDCDDGLYCNGVELCDALGACAAGTPPCAPSECDESRDSCGAPCEDVDGDGHASPACGGDDCDDADPARHPGAAEVCDGDDEDCDPTTLGERDADGDGATARACCNDATCGADCDDTSPGVGPTVPDPCDAIDNDCDGAIDEGGTLHRDVDNDGRGDPSVSMTGGCMVGWVFNADDCDDGSQITYRGARERCDGRDNDCSLAGALAGGPDLDEDRDGDRHSPPGAACLSRAELGTDALGFEFPKNDCRDDVASIHADAEEICDNGIDDNCNGVPDDPSATVYRDADGDGHGTPTMPMTITTCTVPAGFARSDDDCDDGRGTRYAGALEICDRIDNDCSTPSTVVALDEDVDGDMVSATDAACVGLGDAMAPPGAFARADCDDSDDTTHPGAPELCDAIDADCSSGGGTALDEDADTDGHASTRARCIGLGDPGGGTALPRDDCDDTAASAYPGRGAAADTTTCDGLDNDCDLATTERMVPCAGGGICAPGGECHRSGRIVDVSAGDEFQCAVHADGIVRCWGSNGSGQLGDGTTTDRGAPRIVSGLTGVLDVATGRHHACALRGDGTVACWGDNSSGQLGDGTTTQRLAPTPVPGLGGVVEIAAGGGRTCARLGNGTLRCWGQNFDGSVGDGTTDARRTPTPVLGIDDAVGIAAGTNHTCARRLDGSAWCWGMNTEGRLGDGTTTMRAAPVAVAGLSGVVHLAAGAQHTCATLADGTLRCWGANASGQLGDGSSIDRPSPTPVTGLSGVVGSTTGVGHTCAWLADGTARCWGSNADRRLGDGSALATRATPSVVVGLAGVAVLSAGWEHTCGALIDGSLLCWGRRFTPLAAPVPDLAAVVGVAAQENGTCAWLRDGTARCWGRNDYGQVGDGGSTNRLVPTVVGMTFSPFTGVIEIAGGGNYACSRQDDARVWCWGYNGQGQLGTGSTITQRSPSLVSGIATAVEVAAGGGAHTCARLADGTLRCWGYNASGQVGDGTMVDRRTPTAVPSVSAAVGLALGAYHTCARLLDGTLSCWGDNRSGQLGDGSTTNRSSAAPVPGIAGAIDVCAGSGHTCALLADGTVQCWGENGYGELGDGGTTDRASPGAVPGLSGVVQIEAFAQQTCARLGDGTLRCWGVGLTWMSPTPQPVVGLGDVVDLSVGQLHACALTRAGDVWCWGGNAMGQLGDGTTTFHASPMIVTPL